MVTELSVLIPVYNRSVLELVQMLAQQTAFLFISVEIRIYDDGSEPAFKTLNQGLENFPNVLYQELSENVGRSQIRHLMAKEARYSTLLFLDNDVLPVRPDFLKSYIASHAGGVTVGGVAYSPICPEPSLKLRWLYGRNREEASANERMKSPYARLFLSDLMVEKALFLTHFQQDAVKSYGHEDTVFTGQLSQHQIPIKHIDNPVNHLGLETGAQFLEKTKSALQNLVHLHKSGLVKKEGVTLLEWHYWLKRAGVVGLLNTSSPWLLPRLEKNLTSNHPSLNAFDLYRLLLLNQLMRF